MDGWNYGLPMSVEHVDQTIVCTYSFIGDRLENVGVTVNGFRETCACSGVFYDTGRHIYTGCPNAAETS
jgi:hypothetical protein